MYIMQKEHALLTFALASPNCRSRVRIFDLNSTPASSSIASSLSLFSSSSLAVRVREDVLSASSILTLSNSSRTVVRHSSVSRFDSLTSSSLEVNSCTCNNNNKRNDDHMYMHNKKKVLHINVYTNHSSVHICTCFEIAVTQE